MRVLVLLLFSLGSCAGWLSVPPTARAAQQPRLIVVISIDQLPARYLDQHCRRFADDGFFKRLMAEGAWFVNCHHRHAFTTTGPGHSTILTGADPARTGIVGNAWFDRTTGAEINCVDDADATPVGSPTGEASSPRNLLMPTLGDQLKLATSGKAKVFGVSWKDRSAILMAGHAADGCFWFDEGSGNWITSTYYRSDLPGYLRNFNEGDSAEQFAGKHWELLLPVDQYDQLLPDDNPFEANFPGFGRAFPHKLPEQIGKPYYTGVGLTPFGTDITLAVAGLIIEHERLGQDEVTDVLCVGLSANDYVGHAFGPDSLEVQDITARTDRQLASFMAFIQSKLSGAPWVLAVTSDHGVAPIPELAATLKLPAVRNPLGDLRELQSRLEDRLRNRIGTPSAQRSYVQKVDGVGVYLQRDLPELNGDRFAQAQELVREELQRLPHVAAVHTRFELSNADSGDGLSQQFRRAFHPPRSPDILYALAPYCVASSNPTSHGSPWSYDSHVPLFFWGPGVKPGRYTDRVAPMHIGPTLGELLGIGVPAGSAVEPLRKCIE
jgi:predicted AlkP superfamily pyrophosphatase or phosphodiesterase